MAFTDNCDLFGSVEERAINLVGRHVMRQRPSLFNYGTARIAENRRLWCRKVEVAPDVVVFSNPVMAVVAPLPIPGTAYALEYCLQIAEVEIDFHPNDVVAIPAELGSSLPGQHFAGMARVCAGLGCPAERLSDYVAGGATNKRGKERGGTIPAAELDCFCLDVFVVGHVETDGVHLGAVLDGLEIVDIEPDGLESSLECYLATAIRLAILPQLRVALPAIALDLLNLATATLSPTPAPGTVPNNPAIEDDQLKAFIDVAVAP
jgi:hypothetical protein